MEGLKFALLFCLLAVYWSWDGVSAATTKAAAKATTKAAAKATTKAAAKATTKKPTVKATTTKLPPLLLTNQKVTTKYPSLLGFAAAEEEEDNIFTMVKTTAKPNNQRTTVRYIDNDGMVSLLPLYPGVPVNINTSFCRALTGDTHS